MTTKSKTPSLAKRLDAWTRAFATRRDLTIKTLKRGRPWKGAPNSIYLKGEIDQFYTENNGFQLTWRFKKPAPDTEEGGVLNILTHSGARIIWNDDPGFHAAKYIEGLLLDVPSTENRVLVVRRYVAGSRAKETVVVSDKLSSMSARDFGTLEAYLTEGARNAFGWDWQQPTSTAVIDTLRARSLAAGSGPERIIAGLVDHGVPSDEASALSTWLGDDARLLLEAD
jgi:hypothetical protein